MKNKDLLNNHEGQSNSNLKGTIALVGFEVLDQSEQDVALKVVESYLKKLSTLGDLQEMKISLRQHQHGKTFKHELNALAIFKQGRFDSAVTEWNLYTALSSVCEKILSEVEHKIQKQL